MSYTFSLASPNSGALRSRSNLASYSQALVTTQRSACANHPEKCDDASLHISDQYISHIVYIVDRWVRKKGRYNISGCRKLGHEWDAPEIWALDWICEMLRTRGIYYSKCITSICQSHSLQIEIAQRISGKRDLVKTQLLRTP